MIINNINNNKDLKKLNYKEKKEMDFSKNPEIQQMLESKQAKLQEYEKELMKYIEIYDKENDLKQQEKLATEVK